MSLEVPASLCQSKKGKTMTQNTLVRAIYRAGALHLLEPVDLPEGVEVEVTLRPTTDTGAAQRGPLYPTRPQPPETLARLRGLVAVGGDALLDSETLYEGNCH
jgi:predicted DNA-binding antitoxin AbrB/MazE fold protein